MSRLCLWCHRFLHIYFLFRYITAAPEHRFTFALIKWHNTSYPRASPTHICTRRVWAAEQMKVFNWRPRIRCERVPLWCLRNIWAWQGGFLVHWLQWLFPHMSALPLGSCCCASSLRCYVQPGLAMMSDGPRSLQPQLSSLACLHLGGAVLHDLLNVLWMHSRIFA